MGRKVLICIRTMMEHLCDILIRTVLIPQCEEHLEQLNNTTWPLAVEHFPLCETAKLYSLHPWQVQHHRTLLHTPHLLDWFINSAKTLEWSSLFIFRYLQHNWFSLLRGSVSSFVQLKTTWTAFNMSFLKGNLYPDFTAGLALNQELISVKCVLFIFFVFFFFK